MDSVYFYESPLFFSNFFFIAYDFVSVYSGADSFAVDYGGGANLLRALANSTLPLQGSQACSSISSAAAASSAHYVLLSAFCCGKPELQFQFAKLQLEAEIRAMSSPRLSHSIVRPTAYFKSLDGQIEAARKGGPILYFGSGQTAANAISEEDLAEFLVESAVNAAEIGMLNSTRNIGGPDNPPITKLQQIDLIYDALDIPPMKRRTISIPLSVFQVLISSFKALSSLLRLLGQKELSTKAEDAVEIIRIVKYYATEPMVAIGEGEIQGEIRLRDHFCNIAGRGGCLLEVDQYTTTAGVLDLVLKNDYVK